MVPNSSRCWDGGYQTEMFPIFARHFHKDYFETRHDSFLRNTVHNSRFSFGLSSCSSLISTGLNFYLSRDSDFRNKCFEEQKKVVCLFVCLLACSQLDVCLLLGWKYSCQVMLISKDVTSCCKDQTWVCWISWRKSSNFLWKLNPRTCEMQHICNKHVTVFPLKSRRVKFPSHYHLKTWNFVTTVT
jgi:hypothetical protein